MKPKISIVTLGVANLEKATHFYAEGLKLPRYEWDGNITFFALQGTWLSLFPKADLAKDANLPLPTYDNSFSGVSLAHNVPSRSDVDALLRTAQAAGATITKEGSNTSWGGYSGYFLDLDNHLWEIAWNPHQDLS